MKRIEIIDTNVSNICDYGFCGFRNPELEGHRTKANWLKKRFTEGMKFKVLQVDGEDAGMIEYTPGEYSWRPVKAAGYMVIHCIMINKKKYQGKGYGTLLVEESVKDAKKAKMNGVVVVTSNGTWMAGKSLFRRCGFESVDTAPPSFELMVRKLRKAPSPRFEAGWDRSLRKYASGLTIIKSDQCPCIAKCTNDILQVCRELEIHPRIVELKSGSQARKAPSAYGIFNIVYNGDLVADHPIGGTRFKSIMKKVAK